MIDLVISGGTVVDPGRALTRADLGIDGGRIVERFEPGMAPPAREVIDATGYHLFPGGVDPHVHFGITNEIAEDYAIDGAAAAVGGYTTVVSFYRHADSYLGTIPRLVERVAQHTPIDFALSLGLLRRRHWAEFRETILESGVTSWKFYRMYEGIVGQRFGVEDPLTLDDADLLATLRLFAETSERLRLCIHCEEMSISRSSSAEVRARPDLRHTLAEFAGTSPGYAESSSLLNALYLSSLVGASNLYIVHLSSGSSVDILENLPWLRERAGAIVETTPHYLNLTSESSAGLWAMVGPPIQGSGDRDRLWEGVRSGLITSYGSDHCSTRPASARGAQTIWDMDLGFGGVGLMFPLMLSEGYHRRGLALTQIASLTSAAPARAMGLYPRKGSLDVGSDADVTMVDLDLEQKVTLDLSNVSESYSVYEGMSLRGWPVMTIRRGERIAEHGRILRSTGGTYLARVI
jgi:dihydropyrimidinase